LQIGDEVFAIGNALEIGEPVTAGIVTGLDRDMQDSPYDHYIQIDAAINHGNSGGPLFDMRGAREFGAPVAARIVLWHQPCDPLGFGAVHGRSTDEIRLGAPGLDQRRLRLGEQIGAPLVVIHTDNRSSR
jgi:Trypsin-like peptidase domain